MIGRWGPASGHDQTDASSRSWNLTGSDRMLGSYVWSWHYAASGHHLTVGIGCSVFEERDDVAAIRGPDAGRVRPVDLTRASGHPMLCLVKGYNDSILWGLLFKSHGRLKLTLLVICIDIATL